MSEPLDTPLSEFPSLGQPIPGATHAVSVSLPRWQDVVGYEKQDPEVISRLISGYPRFVIHPLVQQAAAHLAGDCPALPFPTLRTATQAAGYVSRTMGEPAALVPGNGLVAVMTSAIGLKAMRSFWQHAGVGLSSRQAEAVLEGRPPAADHAEVRQSLRLQLAELYDCSEDDVLLTPSGMAAQFAALQIVLARRATFRVYLPTCGGGDGVPPGTYNAVT